MCSVIKRTCSTVHILKMLMLMWIQMLLYDIVDSQTQKKVAYQPNPVISAAPGDNVTLHCFLHDVQNSEPIVWYKQEGGHKPSLVAVVQKVQDPIYQDDFVSPRFRIEKGSQSFHLKITDVKPSDEAVYYCGLITFYIVFANGTYLSVKGNEDVSVSVWQRGVSDSVPAGASVTLQCSVLSESRAAELQVLWFRAAPPQSHPQIIYTHHNSRHQCESDSSTHTCVYNFSKNIVSLNDTGTYYCAVLLCGKIIFGNGTPVQMQNVAASYNPVVICLGTALVMCGILISVQTVLLCKRKNGPRHRERIQHDAVINTDETNTQVDELNYAALHFNERKIKRVRGNRGPSQDSVYSEVKHSSISHIK
ncbi:uncharacterized protein LOC113646003 isoform X1 [Tachysurus fulvidraco]|uniref:uncharacterized protein LOC113646003 isoform X1 n=1 Tax=Tachysurus fulvidraco TaxID=1234273 RepID=UPI001FEF25E1|nr:uncharacterized protein LOC113646003 isoform X1 [Tachysurus fulvidraco]